MKYQTNIEVLRSLIRTHPLGACVFHAAGDLHVHHIPFLLREPAGEPCVLTGHLARSDKVCELLAQADSCVVIFQGAEAYISPSFYPSKQVSGRVVPTWNYAVVHAHGQTSRIEDPALLRQHINQMTDTFEAGQKFPWKVSDAPPDYIEQQIRGIVGIEIRVHKLVGRWKVSQNKSVQDQHGVVAGLLQRGDAGSQRMATMVGRPDEFDNACPIHQGPISP